MNLDRREFIAFAGASLLEGQQNGALSANYAESAALDCFTRDAQDEIAIRIGRFPRRSSATLWARVCFGDVVYSAALEDLKLGAFEGRTPVETEKVTFAVTGDGQASLSRTSNERLRGSARVSVGAHRLAEPPPVAGPVSIRIEAQFESSHSPVQVRPGRMEVMGRAEGVIHVEGKTRRIKGYGKWHEQVGDRPRFAPAFTYMNLIGEQAGLLVMWRKAGTSGYAWTGGTIVRVKAAEFDPIAKRRKFRASLENGMTVEGEAITYRVTSEPIEGQRRPGTTVLVTSTLGKMTGHLNDWDPKD